jgi:Ca2+-binding EF-hand superfamily protein
LTESDFATADVNEDGVISKGEMLDHFGPEAQIALAKFDKNGDDTVTLDEVRSSDDPNGERGRGRLERSTETSNTRGNSGNRSEGNGQGSGRGRATR